MEIGLHEIFIAWLSWMPGQEDEIRKKCQNHKSGLGSIQSLEFSEP